MRGETTLGTSAAAASEPIVVRGARVHNLQNIDVEIPAGCLVVVTGVSGSGKSSLAFDTVYAEGQRRYVESLSAYARQFLERMDKPLVDEVRGVCPAIAIQQRVPPRNSRSTVGTVTEIQDYLRLLFARAGRTICPSCGSAVRPDTPGEVTERLLHEHPEHRALIAFPRPLPNDDAPRLELLQHLLKQGFRRLLVEGAACELAPRQLAELASTLRGDHIDVIADRLHLRHPLRERLLDSVGVAFREGEGRARVWIELDDGLQPRSFDDRYRCADCDRDFLRPEPRLFSFNNPYGACPECKGFGSIIEIDLDKVIPDRRRSLADGAVEPWNKESRHRVRKSMRAFAAERGIPLDVAWADLESEQRDAILDGGDGFVGVHGFFAGLRKKQHKLHVRVLLARYRGYVGCPACHGTRLRVDAHAVQVDRRTLPEVSRLSIGEIAAFFADLELPVHAAVVVDQVLREIRARLRYLVEVGLDYVTLDRLTGTLSGGEAQRISLATCLGSMLVGSMYVLDEPSVGLHPRDNERLISILERLRDLGNTVLVVEHDRQMIEGADHLIDMGPGAGVLGGRVVFAGAPNKIGEATDSVTSAYLAGDRRVPMPALRRPTIHQLRVVGARQHNLKNIDVTFPLGVLCCVTGVSGSGKSTLIHDVLHAGLLRRLGEWNGAVGDHDDIEGAGLIRQAVLVDQAPIGRSARSNPVTYVKAFDPIRKRFAATREARARGYGPGHFSFNVAGGRCEVCQGVGQILVEMQFLPDVNLPCEECGGTRFRRETLDIRVRGKNIHDVLHLTVGEARRFFADLPKAESHLKALEDVGLGYLRLGQPSSTLSGGEAQRVKLASHLLQGGGKGMLYLFDEPTTGLHFDDISKLLFALNRLIDTGASAIVIEHNLDLIKAADWVIDLGPEGGDGGGSLVAVGTPEEVAACDGSHTARYLRDVVYDD
ncbi:MAG TPA: excinuclease ABC subunit UvrA [Acidobacteriota bacterium]|nr:excinuclease ABC subunit UvrA [Acidobacteriota bacterium]